MKCKQCGAEFDGKFCPQCGTRVQESPCECPTAGGRAQAQADPQRKKLFFLKWWVILIAAVVITGAIIGICVSVGNGVSSDSGEWEKIELHDIIPDPKFKVDTVMTNTDEELWISYKNVSDDDYREYVDKCIEAGFTIDADKSDSSYTAYNSDGYLLDLLHIDSLTVSLKAPMNLQTISWPAGETGKQLPAPKSLKGKFSYENEKGFYVYIGETSKADYDKYVEDCYSAGFTVDYDKGESYFQAYNENGYHVYIRYEGNNIMTIDISYAKENELVPDETPEPSAAASPEASPSKDNKDESADGMRSDFKEAMDAYEAAMDEYIAFMNKYYENPNDLSILSDYSKYMEKYTDAMEKFEKWESKDMNDAELKYYIKVQTRVAEKLAKLGQ